MSGRKIILGAGGTTQEGWVSTERSELDIMSMRSFENYLKGEKAGAFVAEHVFEHLTPLEGIIAARNCLWCLEPGGWLRIAVPDRLHRDPEYIRWTEPGGIGPGADDHKSFYDLETLSSMLVQAGFTRILPLEWWGSDRRFHALPWSADQGFIRRSLNNDPRNATRAIPYTSLIVDAVNLAGA